MLPAADNRLLTEVGPGTPGGEVLRHYWLPVLLSYELEPDGPPLRARLLGEDLIAFRTITGGVGLVANACPHRGASLFFGRNEAEGLRCVYHGWKFDVEGACVDMPSEPAESNFKSKVRAKAYPCVERNGVVWAHMGQSAPPPPLPELEWNLVPPSQSYVSKRVQRCNWFQALEGAIDSTHSNFIHSPLNREPFEAGAAGRRDEAFFKARVKYLHFETLQTANGVIVANRRDADDDSDYWRANHYLMPFYTMFPPTVSLADSVINGHAWVPIDDENTLVFFWSYNPERPLTEAELEAMRHTNNGVDGFHISFESRLPPNSGSFGAWRPRQGKENDYMLDYEAQRTSRFSGVPGGWNQDAAVQESMGEITDRRREHLGTSDLGIIAARRYFVGVANAWAQTKKPPGALDEPSRWAVRPASRVIPKHQDWLLGLRQIIEAPRSVGPRLAIEVR